MWILLSSLNVLHYTLLPYVDITFVSECIALHTATVCGYNASERMSVSFNPEELNFREHTDP